MAMLKALMDYGAVAAKVKALYGRMLDDSDWSRTKNMRTVQELFAFLKTHPGWSSAAGTLPPGAVDPRALERALRLQLCEEYERLFRFASGQDKKFLLLTLYQAEYSLILASLRRLGSVNALPAEDILPQFYIKKSASDLDGIKNADSFQKLLDAADGGIYSNTLRALPKNADTGLPDYRQASIALENRCYTAVYSFLTRGFSGKKRDELTAYIGERADLLNITSLLRLRRFPASLQNARQLLIPIRHKLRAATVDAIIAAPDEKAVLEILSPTPWGKYFTTLAPNTLERQFGEYVQAFCRRLITSPTPSICIPQAYLTLKGIECGKLITLIEALRLGFSPNDVE